MCRPTCCCSPTITHRFSSSDQTHTRGSVAARPPRRVAPTAGPIHPGAPRAQFSAGVEGGASSYSFAPLNRSGPRQSVERFDAPSADGLSSRSPIMASLAIGRRRLEPSRGTGSSRASVGTVRSGGSGVAPWTSRRSPNGEGTAVDHATTMRSTYERINAEILTGSASSCQRTLSSTMRSRVCRRRRKACSHTSGRCSSRFPTCGWTSRI